MGKGRVHVPQRTCIVCRSKRDKKDLVRFVLDYEGHLVKDGPGTKQGRGIYVCPRNSCLENLWSNKVISRVRAIGALRGKKFSGIAREA